MKDKFRACYVHTIDENGLRVNNFTNNICVFSVRRGRKPNSNLSNVN